MSEPRRAPTSDVKVGVSRGGLRSYQADHSDSMFGYSLMRCLHSRCLRNDLMDPQRAVDETGSADAAVASRADRDGCHLRGGVRLSIKPGGGAPDSARSSTRNGYAALGRAALAPLARRPGFASLPADKLDVILRPPDNSPFCHPRAGHVGFS